MKKILSIGFFVFIAIFVVSAQAREDLVLSISGFRNNNGKVLVAVYKTAEGFPMDSTKALRSAEAVIANGKAEVRVAGLEPGTYAISVFHDENSNYRLETGWFGIPTEGLGVSNNAKGNFGPPAFKDAAVTYSGPELRLSISMVYL